MMERSVCAFIMLALFSAVSVGSALAGVPRITQNIDEREVTTLSGNTRPEASSGRDLGAVPAGRMLEHLQLELQRSAQEEQAVEDYIGSLHDPSSPLFHHWMSSAEFGARFGVAESDLAIIETWLTAHGFTVNAVYPGRMVIDFSGTEGQLATTFHTELHRIQVNGVAHLANVRDPSIPAALAPVIAGIIKLNDFHALRKHRPAPKFTGDCEPSVKCYLMAPADLATIYDFNPLFHGARPITGKGQRIAVVEDTDLYTDKDWSDFREIFGLAHYTAGSLSTIHPPPPPGGAPCQDPGVNADGDDVEAALDAEWSSAAAPEAAILLAACNNTETIDGVQQAIHHLIDGSANPPGIISVSYGICETENGAASNAAFAHMYQQADAEGVSVFVATGDSGPEDCAPNFTSPATLGVGVNAWASTPHNVAVGGTDFSDSYAGTNSHYWSASHGAPWGTAKSYIPEMPWNDTCAGVELTFFEGYTVAYGAAGFCNSAAGSNFLGTGGGEGGPSGCATGSPTIAGVVSGTCKGWPKPSYQRGLYGVPDDGVRDVPDVAMFAADGVWGHQYLLCFSDPNNFGTPCVGDPASWGQGGGGTSYSTPIVAGIQALVNQKMGEAQGNPNFVYYRLAAREYGPWGNPNCNSSNGTDQGPECVFHDVTTGNDAQDCTGRHDCYRPSGHYGVLSTSDGTDEVAFDAHAGYDYPTGIGTIDAAKLVNAWAAGLSCSDP